MQSGFLMLPTWALIAVCALLATLYWFSNWLRMLPIMLRMPGPPALPIIGNALMVANSKQLVHLGHNVYKLYGPVARMWISVLPLVLVNEPQYVQAVLSSSKNTDKARFYGLLHNFLGQGLLTSSGENWRTHRKIIQPAFHVSFLEKFVSTFAVGSNALVEALKPKTQLSAVNVTSLINDAVIGMLKEAVLDIPYRPSIPKEDQSPYRKGKVTAQYRISHPWLLLNWIYDKTEIAKNELDQKSRLFNFTQKVVTERQEQRLRREDNTKSNPDDTNNNTSFLDFMIGCLEENKTLSEHEVIHELCTFMLAGQDSVGSALAFCIYLLAQNPTVQQSVFEELESIFQDSGRDATIQDLRSMRLLDRCIKETLRMYPSVPVLARRINEDIPMGKFTLPAGCEVVVSPFILHHLPHVWENPTQFDPDRFLPKNCAKRHPYAYIPFSAGPRNCIGYKFSLLEMKMVLSSILRKYELLAVPGRENVTLSYRITLRASGGIWVKLVPRD